jgi:hypothetical protein
MWVQRADLPRNFFGLNRGINRTARTVAHDQDYFCAIAVEGPIAR